MRSDLNIYLDHLALLIRVTVAGEVHVCYAQTGSHIHTFRGCTPRYKRHTITSGMQIEDRQPRPATPGYELFDRYPVQWL